MQPLPWDMIGTIFGVLSFILTLLIEWNKMEVRKRLLLSFLIGIGVFFIVFYIPPLLLPTSETVNTETPANFTTESASSETLLKSTITYGKLVYEENFDEIPNGWSLGSFMLDNGSLIMSPDSGITPYDKSGNEPPFFTDFIFESQFSFQNNANRMEFRIKAQYPECNGYNCNIVVVIDHPYENIVAYRWENDEHDSPLALRTINYEEIELLENQLSRITIIADSEEYSVYINDYYIFKFNDRKYRSGTFNLWNDGLGMVSIDYIRFYELP